MQSSIVACQPAAEIDNHESKEQLNNTPVSKQITSCIANITKTGHEHHDGLGQAAGTHHGQQISLVHGHLLLMHTHALLNAGQIPHDGDLPCGNGAIQQALSNGANPAFDQTSRLIDVLTIIGSCVQKVLKWHIAYLVLLNI